MQYISPDVATICTGMAVCGRGFTLCRTRRQAISVPSCSRVMIHQILRGAQGQAPTLKLQHRDPKLKDELLPLLNTRGKPWKRCTKTVS